MLEEIHPRYVKLSNGEFTWSVQRFHYSDDPSDEDPIFETAFWKVVSKEDLLYKKIEEQHNEIQLLKQKLSEYES